MNEQLKSVIFFIGVGLAIGFTLIVYAHGNFATKDTVARIEAYQKDTQLSIKDNIKEIKEDIKYIRDRIK